MAGATRRFALALALAAALVVLLPAASAPAFTYTVNTTSDPTPGLCGAGRADCSIREAINASNASTGTADIVSIPGGTYQLSQGPLVVADGVTIRGGGATQTVVKGRKLILCFNPPCASPFRVFTIDANPTLTDTVAFEDLTVTNGQAAGSGGGIFNQDDGALVLNRVVVSNNRVTQGGSGITASFPTSAPCPAFRALTSVLAPLPAAYLSADL